MTPHQQELKKCLHKWWESGCEPPRLYNILAGIIGDEGEPKADSAVMDGRAAVMIDHKAEIHAAAEEVPPPYNSNMMVAAIIQAQAIDRLTAEVARLAKTCEEYLIVTTGHERK